LLYKEGLQPIVSINISRFVLQ